MAGARVAPPAEIDVGADGLREAPAVEPGDGVVAIGIAELVDIGALLGDEPLPVHRFDQARPPVAGDAVFLDEAERRRLGLLGEVPQAPRCVQAQMRLQPVLVVPLAAVQLAAIAPRGAPADAVLLHQHHVDAGLGQMQRRRQAGEAAADNGDVGA